MIALTRTQSTTALLCLSFLLTGAGCQQQADTPQQSNNEAAAIDSTTELAHDEHVHDAYTEQGHDAHEESHEGHDHAGHDHAVAAMTTYACQPKQTIKAHYDSGDSVQPATSAHLLIDGVEYDLTAIALPQTNRAGAAYETDIGITNDTGMRWQVNADTTRAILSNKTLDGSVAEDAETVLFDCQKTDS